MAREPFEVGIEAESHPQWNEQSTRVNIPTEKYPGFQSPRSSRECPTSNGWQRKTLPPVVKSGDSKARQ